jgi:hypothetical protein
VSERETPETDAAEYSTTYNNGTWAGGKRQVVNSNFALRLERQRDEFKIWWERDSKGLSVALGQRDTARAVAEDNRARYVTAERQRDDLAEVLRELLAAESDYNASLDGTTALLRYRLATKQARALIARIDAEKNERGRG